jgi:hypothetical protein
VLVAFRTGHLAGTPLAAKQLMLHYRFTDEHLFLCRPSVEDVGDGPVDAAARGHYGILGIDRLLNQQLVHLLQLQQLLLPQCELVGLGKLLLLDGLGLQADLVELLLAQLEIQGQLLLDRGKDGFLDPFVPQEFVPHRDLGTRLLISSRISDYADIV